MRVFRVAAFSLIAVVCAIAGVRAMAWHGVTSSDVQPWWFSCSAVIEKPYEASRSVELRIYNPYGQLIAYAANNYENSSMIHASVGVVPHDAGTYECVGSFWEDSEYDEITHYVYAP
jgi:hypothetical protein